MDEKEKIQVLLDMQAHPEAYSEETLNAMLEDPDVRELMEATAELKQAMVWEESTARPDVDAEWQRFEREKLKVKSEKFATAEVGSRTERAAANFSLFTFHFSLQKVAASIIGILMVSGIAFAAIHVVRQSVNQKETTTVESPQLSASQQPIAVADTIASDTTNTAYVRYEEATLEQILTGMADYYGLTLHWKNEEAKALRLFYIWNKQQPAGKTIESMNTFERIRLELSDSILTADIQTNSPKK